MTPLDKKTAIENIAKGILGIETLETRRSDSLDFYDRAVWTIEEALAAAYEAGKVAGHYSSRTVKKG